VLYAGSRKRHREHGGGVIWQNEIAVLRWRSVVAVQVAGGGTTTTQAAVWRSQEGMRQAAVQAASSKRLRSCAIVLTAGVSNGAASVQATNGRNGRRGAGGNAPVAA